MYGTAKTPWISFLPQLPPHLQPRPSLPPVPLHANAATHRHSENVLAITPIHPSPSSPNSSPPSLLHLYPRYPPLLLTAKSRWVLPPPSLSPAPHSPAASIPLLRPAAHKPRQPPPSRKRHRFNVNPSQPTIIQFFSTISTPPPTALSTTTSNCETALGPGSSLDPHD